MRLNNLDSLINHGDTKGREQILTLLEAGVSACEPYNNTRDLVDLEGHTLSIGHPDFEAIGDPQSGTDVYDIRQFKHIYVVGAGKGVFRVAEALEDVLGGYLTGGEIICKYGDKPDLKKIHVSFGAHPTPDDGCVAGCQRILALAEKVVPEDLVFTVIANGGSSLLTLPVKGVTVKDVIDVTRLCQIELGMTTQRLNAIRNHIDQLKGGKLARAFSRARLVNIAVEDLNQQDMTGMHDFDYLMHNGTWLHNMPEGSSFSDALQVIREFGIEHRLPARVMEVLREAAPRYETVKYEEYSTYRYRVFGVMPRCRSHLEAVRKKALEMGYTPYVLTRHMNVHAADMGEFIASMGRCIEDGDSGIKAPAVLIVRGEMIVATSGGDGVGGRNQECILSVCRHIAGYKKIVCVSVDTDGTDGPGGFSRAGAPACYSGGIVDGSSYARARACGIDVEEALRTHNTTAALHDMGDAVLLSQGISLGDLLLCLVAK